MGHEGFSARRRCCTTAARRRRCVGRRGRRRPARRDAPCAHDHPLLPAPPAHRRRSPSAATSCTGRTRLLGNDDVARRLGRARRPTARCTATPSATSSSTCSRARRGSSRVFGALAVGPGDYVVVPAGDHAPLGRHRRRAGRRRSCSRPRGHVAPPGQLPDRARPVPRRRAVLRARPARARRAAARRGRRPTSPVLVRTPRRAVAATSTATTRSTSSGGTAALYPCALSIHDFEPIVGAHPPAAAGAPDLRGPGLRRVLVRAPAASTSTPTR